MNVAFILNASVKKWTIIPFICLRKTIQTATTTSSFTAKTWNPSTITSNIQYVFSSSLLLSLGLSSIFRLFWSVQTQTLFDIFFLFWDIWHFFFIREYHKGDVLKILKGNWNEIAGKDSFFFPLKFMIPIVLTSSHTP